MFKSTMFPHRSVHECIWTSSDVKTLTFWRNTSTIDQIFYIRQIPEKKWEYNGTLYSYLYISKRHVSQSGEKDFN